MSRHPTGKRNRRTRRGEAETGRGSPDPGLAHRADGSGLGHVHVRLAAAGVGPSRPTAWAESRISPAGSRRQEGDGIAGPWPAVRVCPAKHICEKPALLSYN